MSQCNMTFDLKINLGHRDLYFTVQWYVFFYFFAVLWRLLLSFQCVFVCLCVCKPFFRQIFLRNYCHLVQILIWLVVLCKRESASSCLSFPLFVHFSRSNKNFCHRNLGSYESHSSNFVFTLRVAKYIVGKKTKILWLIIAFFSIFSLSHSNVIHREIFVKDFSGATAPRILKFGTSIGYDLLYCVKENQNTACHPLYLSFFSVSKQIFCYKILIFYESQSLQILHTLWEWPSILWDRKQNCWDLFCLVFPFFYLSLQCNA